MGTRIELSKGQYFGSVQNNLSLNGLIITDSHYHGYLDLPNHAHLNPYLCFVLEGGYSEFFYKKAIDCKKGDLVYHPGDFEHHNVFNYPLTRCLNIEFSKQWVNDFEQKKIFTGKILKIADAGVQTILHKIQKEIRNSDGLSPLMIETLSVELLLTLERVKERNSNMPAYMKKIMDYLNDNYHVNPTLAEVAKYAGLSPEHIAREFKKTHRMSIGEYMRHLKIRRACEKLKNPKKEMIEIAFELGFADQSHFCRTFKSIMGVSPLNYRMATN